MNGFPEKDMETRVFTVGQRIHNRSDSRSMYAGMYGIITHVEKSRFVTNISVDYGDGLTERHPSRVVEHVKNDLPEDLFIL